jgi:hypothetical protein
MVAECNEICLLLHSRIITKINEGTSSVVFPLAICRTIMKWRDNVLPGGEVGRRMIVPVDPFRSLGAWGPGPAGFILNDPAAWTGALFMGRTW